MKRIYISGPITKGDRTHNIQQATDAAYRLIEAGFAPFCPHLSCFYPFAEELPHQTWIDVDLPWVAVSDAILLLPGESKGAEMECEFANANDIPVFTDLRDLILHFQSEVASTR